MHEKSVVTAAEALVTELRRFVDNQPAMRTDELVRVLCERMPGIGTTQAGELARRIPAPILVTALHDRLQGGDDDMLQAIADVHPDALGRSIINSQASMTPAGATELLAHLGGDPRLPLATVRDRLQNGLLTTTDVLDALSFQLDTAAVAAWLDKAGPKASRTPPSELLTSTDDEDLLTEIKRRLRDPDYTGMGEDDLLSELGIVAKDHVDLDDFDADDLAEHVADHFDELRGNNVEALREAGGWCDKDEIAAGLQHLQAAMQKLSGGIELLEDLT